MIVKLRIESNRENIRRFTDMLRNDDNIQVNSISEIFPNNKGISIYDKCFAEFEFNNNQEHFSSEGGTTPWQK